MTDRAIRIEQIRVADLVPGDVIRFQKRGPNASQWALVQAVEPILRSDRVRITTNYYGSTSMRPLELVDAQIKSAQRHESLSQLIDRS